MILYKRTFLMLFIVSVLGLAPVVAGEKAEDRHGLTLSPQLMELLRAEMRALLEGVQKLSAGIATGDWRTVADTSAKISGSYILAQKLTPAQKHELEHKLPHYFKRLDAAFHSEAAKLETAARHHDAQLATFHFYRLVEGCATCHSSYAVEKFPGFEPAATGGHAH